MINRPFNQPWTGNGVHIEQNGEGAGVEQAVKSASIAQGWSRVRRSTGVVAVCATGLAFAAPTGTASFKPGGYLGATSQSKTIVFETSKKTVKTLSIDVQLTCKDGTGTFDWSTSAHGLKGKINKKGAFKLAQAQSGFKTVVQGKLKGKKAAGTAQSSYTNDGASCTTGKLTWKAKRS